jgi:large subunit ribosomal protein L23
MNTAHIIIKPIITEQSMKAVDGGKYSFVVAKAASKTDVRKAVKEMFNVTVVSVATSVIKGKTKRVGARRQEIKDSIWKKAVVKVKKGDKISLFEPGGDDHSGHTHSK